MSPKWHRREYFHYTFMVCKQQPCLTLNIIMSHGKQHTRRMYMHLCFAPRDPVSTNQRGRFSLVIKYDNIIRHWVYAESKMRIRFITGSCRYCTGDQTRSCNNNNNNNNTYILEARISKNCYIFRLSFVEVVYLTCHTNKRSFYRKDTLSKINKLWPMTLFKIIHFTVMTHSWNLRKTRAYFSCLIQDPHDPSIRQGLCWVFVYPLTVSGPHLQLILYLLVIHQ